MGKNANLVVDGHNDEPFEHLLRRFNRAVQESGIAAEISKRQYFDKPSVLRHHAEQKARRKIEAQNREPVEEEMIIRRPRPKNDFRDEASRLTERGWRVVQ